MQTTQSNDNADFNSKLQDISHIENGISHLKNALQYIMATNINLKSFIQEITIALKFLYNGNSPYFNLSSNMNNCYLQLDKKYTEYYQKIENLFTQLSELKTSYEYVDDLIDKRAEKKKVYEYYNEKLSKFTSKDEYYERNENKLNIAQKDYFECHNQTYQSIINILSKKYTDINPIFNELYKTNIELYSSALNIFNNSTQDSNQIISSLFNSNSSNKPIYHKKDYMSFNEFNKTNNGLTNTPIPQQKQPQVQFHQAKQGKVINITNNGNPINNITQKDTLSITSNMKNNQIVFSQYDDAYNSLQIKNTMNQSEIILEGANNQRPDNNNTYFNNSSKIII